MSVERALVTGRFENDTSAFDVHVAHIANLIEVRKNTSLYTVMAGDDWKEFITYAKLFQLTVQQRRKDGDPVADICAGEDPYWKVVVQGTAAPWKPEPKKGTKT